MQAEIIRMPVIRLSYARSRRLRFAAQMHEVVEAEGKVGMVEHVRFANCGDVKLETLDGQLSRGRRNICAHEVFPCPRISLVKSFTTKSDLVCQSHLDLFLASSAVRFNRVSHSRPGSYLSKLFCCFLGQYRFHSALGF